MKKDELIIKSNEFRKSESLKEYLEHYKVDYDIALKITGFDIRLEITNLKEALGFCQWCNIFWCALPDSPNIRFGAFYKICDFAEINGGDYLEDCDNENY